MWVSASTSSVVAGSRMPQTTISAVENQVSDGANVGATGGAGGVGEVGRVCARLVCMRPG